MPLSLSVTYSNQMVDPALATSIQLHDQYKSNGQDLLLRSLQDLELLQTQLASNDAEAAERMAERVHEFAKGLRQELVPIQSIPRVFASVGPTSTLPQRKSKGKAKGRTLTSAEMAEKQSVAKRRRKRCVTSRVPVAPAVVENETQDFIYVVPSTAPH